MFASILSAFRTARAARTAAARRPAAGRSGRRLRLESLEERVVLSGVPAAPVFTAATVSSSQVNFHWNAAAGATSYQIDYVVNGAWRQLGNFSGSTTGCSVTGLAANTTYDFDIVATNSAGSHWGTQQFVKTGLNVDHPAASTTYANATGSLFGAGGPSFLDVRQGAVGDCWLLAGLAEVAARRPSDITSMFTYAGTTVENGVTVGLYNVRLYNTAGQARYYLVDTELPAGGGTYDHPANGVLWVALAEKAYAEANGAGQVMSGQRGSDSYAALNGGWANWAFQAVTGQSAGLYNLNTSNLAADMRAGDLVALGSLATHASQYIVGSPSEGTHDYAVVGYNASSSMPFEIYNPWGAASNGMALGTDQGRQVYGLFWANAAFISQNFANQQVGTGAEADAGGDFGSVAVDTAGAGESAVGGTAAADSTRGAAGADAAWANGAMLRDVATRPAAGTAGESRHAADGVTDAAIDAVLASYGVTGRATPAADAEASHSDEADSSDAVWMDAGNLGSSLFALRIA